MFWIGMIVGVGIGIGLVYGICMPFALKYFGVTRDELYEIVEVLEGVGDDRDSEIKITHNKDAEQETSYSMELKEQ